MESASQSSDGRIFGTLFTHRRLSELVVLTVRIDRTGLDSKLAQVRAALPKIQQTFLALTGAVAEGSMKRNITRRGVVDTGFGRANVVFQIVEAGKGGAVLVGITEAAPYMKLHATGSPGGKVPSRPFHTDTIAEVTAQLADLGRIAIEKNLVGLDS